MSKQDSIKKTKEPLIVAANLPKLKDVIVFFSIAFVGALADLISKVTIFAWMKQQSIGEYAVVNNFFNLVIRENSGAAWSSFVGQRFMLISVSLVAFSLILFLFFAGIIHHKITRLAIGFFTAGLLGNLYDRIFHDGKVRDFLDFYWNDYHFPAFNLADSMLCVAVGVLFLSSFFMHKSQN